MPWPPCEGHCGHQATCRSQYTGEALCAPCEWLLGEIERLLEEGHCLGAWDDTVCWGPILPPPAGPRRDWLVERIRAAQAALEEEE